ncbi:hypothetical protein SNE40_003941 [Patella caerulea]|uniref:Inositol polyphosphate-related phosphatase domain-containing protein n=1 Tax=Patella caerulea TaxID=87958 RepID=A0AAN8Q1D2_PATCE
MATASVKTKSSSGSGGKPKKYVGVYLCTWNVAYSKPVDLTDALQLHQSTLPEIYAIGLQEVNNDHTGTGKNSWSAAITDILKPKDYVRVRVRSMQGILLIIFAKRSVLPFITNFESEATRTGLNGLWGNKGGVSVRLDIYGMNVIIVNSHLAAHRDNLLERIEDYDSVIDHQKFKDDDVDNIMDHDYVLWMGDLNFRLNELTKEEAIKCSENKDYEKLLKFDQLILAMKAGLVFEDFHEGEITFPPTYKFDINTDQYDSSEKQRVPAWCDRILWYTHDTSYDDVRLDVQQQHYHSHPVYKISDHKPVSSLFHIQVFPNPPRLPVTFYPIKDFRRKRDNLIKYKMVSSGSSYYNDWIGLYKADFTALTEYVTYIWAVQGVEKRGVSGVTLAFTKEWMSAPPGEYCLLYLTKNYSLLGISQTFQVLP